MRTVLDDVSVVDVVAGRTLPRRQVVLDGDRIATVTDAGAPAEPDADRPDVAGLTVAPGLIDCHVHVKAWTADLAEVSAAAGVVHRAAGRRAAGAMLHRGFTTVRDAGGAGRRAGPRGRRGWVPGPRLRYCGHALSQTGGHGDTRGAGEACWSGAGESLSRVADGVDGLRVACRDELRQGAHFLKVMVSGGISSPTDRLDSLQYGTAELAAAVEEATQRRPVRHRPRVHGRVDPARGRGRLPLGRARQPHRRADRRPARREGHVRGRHAGHVRGAAPSAAPSRACRPTSWPSCSGSGTPG